MFTNNPVLTYVGFVLALLAMVAGIFQWFDPNIAWAVAVLFGFGGVAEMRTFIKSKGWCTYTLAAFSIVPAVLLLFEVITIVSFLALMGIGTTLTGVAVQYALQKTRG